MWVLVKRFNELTRQCVVAAQAASAVGSGPAMAKTPKRPSDNSATHQFSRKAPRPNPSTPRFTTQRPPSQTHRTGILSALAINQVIAIRFCRGAGGSGGSWAPARMMFWNSGLFFTNP